MKKAICAGAAGLLWVASAVAESQFGVEIYPGARADAEVEKQIRSMKLDGKTYRTTDSVAKVGDFYRKQPSLKQNPGANPGGAGFSGKGVMVTIQNPWMDMKTGKITNDTLISIVKQ